MIKKLCTPVDEEHNEHKRLQLRELAALNGTLKEQEACFLCGDYSHSARDCPTKDSEVYKLPDEVQAAVQQQYERDVARVRGPDAVVKQDEEYKAFLQDLGGAPPPELMGLDSISEWHVHEYQRHSGWLLSVALPLAGTVWFECSRIMSLPRQWRCCNSA